jgi:hypothetical protein
VALMGGVLVPAALLLRRMRWLYWWSVPPVAAATALLPLIAFCGSGSGECGSRGFAAVAGSLMFASLCGGLFLWRSWLRHHASQPGIAQRIAACSPAVKLGLVFLAGYGAIVAAAIIFVAAYGGESGMIFLYITLPWPFVGGRWLGDTGAMAGLPLGLLLNAALSFGIGYGIGRLHRTSA